jgi:hypothetical protein
VRFSLKIFRMRPHFAARQFSLFSFEEVLPLRALSLVAIITAIVGAACLVVAAQSPAYVDANGRLVEPFAWMVSG